MNNLERAPRVEGDKNVFIAGEYKKNYIIIQKEILKELPDDQARLDWIERYGRIYHDLAADDQTFHDLLTAESPDLELIRRHVEQTAADQAEESQMKH